MIPFYRVSHVEAFRRFEEGDDISAETLAKRIRGEEKPTQRMEAGTAFHSVLEHIEPGRYDSISAHGFTFQLPGAFVLPVAGIRELRASKTYWPDDEPIIISGQVDAIEGLRIEDHKTTASLDAEGYFAGYQWRFYLDIFGADVFRWNVFEIAPVPKAERTYRLKAQHRLEQFRYPALEADCDALVTRFARFVREHIE